MSPPRDRTVAAVDLGSNSFHMIVARIHDGHLQIIDRLRETVRLAGGMDARRRLSQPAQQRALECLQRFGQRLRDLPKVRVRVVGTNTLRVARNAGGFKGRAEKALGHPIEVISGREEARLIYLGVARGLADASGERRLVIDIGGGSTEFIIGEAFKAIERESLAIGCVESSEAYFDGGAITAKRMKAAETAASAELQSIVAGFRKRSWGEVVGASGTIRAIRDIVNAAGWCEQGITAEALRELRAALIDSRKVSKAPLKGLTPDRAAILPGGVAILGAIFEAFAIERMSVSEMALREGLLYDLVGRFDKSTDVRSESVAALARLYRVDDVHVDQVVAIAANAFDGLARAWALSAEHRDWLAWAAQLHEVGLQVSHSSFHKHGAYIIEHFDLPGFSNEEQRVLAGIVRGHRRKFVPELFETLPNDWIEPAIRLCVILRLAALLRRTRGSEPTPAIRWRGGVDALSLGFPRGWLARHALTRSDLEQEKEALADGGFRLSFR